MKIRIEIEDVGSVRPNIRLLVDGTRTPQENVDLLSIAMDDLKRYEAGMRPPNLKLIIVGSTHPPVTETTS